MLVRKHKVLRTRLPGKGISVPIEQFDKVMALLSQIKQVEESAS
ncbi:MAG: hypothetical protein ACYCVB_05635 [Bacilli bacterium]